MEINNYKQVLRRRNRKNLRHQLLYLSIVRRMDVPAAYVQVLLPLDINGGPSRLVQLRDLSWATKLWFATVFIMPRWPSCAKRSTLFSEALGNDPCSTRYYLSQHAKFIFHSKLMRHFELRRITIPQFRFFRLFFFYLLYNHSYWFYFIV